MPVLPARNVSTAVIDVTQVPGQSGSGTVTSIDVSGGTTGLTFTGGPINVTGTITAGGTLAVANGGTGTNSLPASGYVKSTGAALTSQAPPVPVTDGGTGTTTAFTQGRVVITGAAGVYAQDANLNYDAATDALTIGDGAAIANFDVAVHKTAAAVSGIASTTDSTTGQSVVAAKDFYFTRYGDTFPGTIFTGVNAAGAGQITGPAAGDVAIKTSNQFAIGITGMSTPSILGTAAATSFQIPYATTLGALTLANGLNSNITTPASSFLHATGPSAAFSVGGFVSPTNGQRLTLYNGTFQTMTVVNEDASSTATNRIKTLTGANYTLPAGAQSVIELVYDSTDQRWILTNDGSNTGYLKADGTVPLTANWPAGAFNITSKNSRNFFNAVTGYGMSTGGTAAANTTALNNAITDANAAGGGVVYIPVGTYSVNAITLKQFVTLQGDGMFSTILAGASAVDIVTIDGTASTNVYNAIRDLCIASSGTATRCLNIKNAWFVDIDRCRIATGATETILVTSTAGISSTHIQFSKCWLTTGAATPVVHGSGNFVTGLQLNDCEISGGSFGVVMDSTDGYDLSCYGSIFEGNTGPGVKLEGSATASATLVGSFTDCYFESNVTADIDINPSGTATSVPQVSVKGGQMVGSTARGIRMNPKCGLLQVEGIYSIGHATADIDLGDLSTTTCKIWINGNNLASATKISSTNPTVSGSSYPLNCAIVPLRLVSSAGLTTTSSTYQLQGYDVMPSSRNFPPGAVYTLVAVLGVSNVATTATLRLANDGAGTVYGTVSSNATGRNLVSATLSNIPTTDTTMQQDLLSTDNVNTATWYGGWVKVTW